MAILCIPYSYSPVYSLFPTLLHVFSYSFHSLKTYLMLIKAPHSMDTCVFDFCAPQWNTMTTNKKRHRSEQWTHMSPDHKYIEHLIWFGLLQINFFGHQSSNTRKDARFCIKSSWLSSLTSFSFLDFSLIRSGSHQQLLKNPPSLSLYLFLHF